MNSLGQTARRAQILVAVIVVGPLLGAGPLAYRRLVRERWAGPLRAQMALNAAAVETFCAADAELATDPLFQPPDTYEERRPRAAHVAVGRITAAKAQRTAWT
ncbi:MAG: hypothetical protein AB1730_26335 [Myxococcota bacterium]